MSPFHNFKPEPMLIPPSRKMNALSFKTNTVLVSKNLAQAQFRCLECQKVFISYRHLEKHTVRRHRESLLNMTGSVITGQHEAFSASDRKLIEVAGRLENVLSLLETKAAENVDRRPSTAWVGPSPGGSPDSLSPIPDENCKHIYVFPASVSDVRKSVSLFTLPKDRRLEPDFKDFGTEDAELCHNSNEERHPKGEGAACSEDENTDELSKKELIVDEEETNSANSTKGDDIQKSPENVLKEVSQVPTGIGCDHIEAAGTLGPLIVDLINKLERVSIETKRVASTCCQTSDTEKDAVLAGAQGKESLTFRKTVSFSENPVIINDDEEDSCQTDSESTQKSENGEPGGGMENHLSAEDNESGTVEDDDNQSCSDSVEDEECFGESELLADSITSSDSASKNRPVNQDGIESSTYDRVSDVKPGQVLKTPKDSCIHHDWEHYENENATQALVRFPDVERELENESAFPQPSEKKFESEIIKPEVPVCFRKPTEFDQTKQQILDLVEKCMEGLKSSSATSLKTESSKSNGPEGIETAAYVSEDRNNSVLNRTDCKIVQSKDTEIKRCDEQLDCKPSEERRETNNVVCVKYESTHSIPGLLAPSSIICKDGGLDIDDMSGNSYEQFMKRFSSDFIKDRKIIEEEIDRISLARKISVDSADPDPILKPSVATDERDPESEIAPVLPQPLTRRNGSDTLVCPKSGASGLKKSEYAVLLHHETSQVQNLIDTLVTDLQRWRNAKKNELSKAIRVQLEERMSSNLNLLGIHNKAKTLSDTAMTSARYLLDQRRSKAVKGPKSSYFDTLKTAFVTEIDRIAKSRTDYPF